MKITRQDFVKGYVNAGLTAIAYVLTPLNAFMKHLLTLQHIDPNTDPEAMHQKELQDAMDSAFESDNNSYDDDYDMSWVQKRFQEARKSLNDLELTREKFMEISNITSAYDGDSGVYHVTAEIPKLAPAKREIRLFPTDAEIAATTDPTAITVNELHKELKSAPKTTKKVSKKANKRPIIKQPATRVSNDKLTTTFSGSFRRAKK